MHRTHCRSNDLITRLIALAYLLLIVSCQPSFGCENSIDIDNLPEECDRDELVCYFTVDQFFPKRQVKQRQKFQQFYFESCINLPEFTIQFDDGSFQLYSFYINANKLLFTKIDDSSIFLLRVQVNTFEVISSKIIIVVLSVKCLNFYSHQSTIEHSVTCDSQNNCNEESFDQEKWNFKFPKLYRSDGIFDISLFQINYFSFQMQNIGYIGIAAENSLIIANQSQFVNTIIALASANLSIISSVVNSSGLGFDKAQGEGCGASDENLQAILNCSGTGGSHGGHGGSSLPEECISLMPRLTYGDPQYPSSFGSGGGGRLEDSSFFYSSGGGAISLQSINLCLINATIEADGYQGKRLGGGGAGGSISIDYTTIVAQGTLSAEGGAGISSGGGGRMRIWDHNWQQYREDLKELHVSVAGGTCSSNQFCGQTGTLYTSPCRPGTQLSSKYVGCQLCPLGYYRTFISSFPCLPCINAPQQSHYIRQDSSNTSLLSQCSFQCNAGNPNANIGFFFYNNQCINGLEQAFSSLGGANAVFILGMVAIVVVVLVISVIVAQVILPEDELLSNTQFGYRMFSKFVRTRYSVKAEDIPFQVCRVFVRGNNTWSDPWKLETNFSMRPTLRDKNLFSLVVQQMSSALNLNAKFQISEKLTLLVVQLCYFPLKSFVLSFFRQKIIERCFICIRKISERFIVSNQIGVKFHAQPNGQTGFVSILDYSRSTFDFCFQEYLPVCIQMQRNKEGGYSVDLEESFVKGMTTLSPNSPHSIQTHLSTFNTIFQTESCLSLAMTHLWQFQLVEIKLQFHLWQPKLGLIKVHSYQIDPTVNLYLLATTQNASNYHFIAQAPISNSFLNEDTFMKCKYRLSKQSKSVHQTGSSNWMKWLRLKAPIIRWTFGFLGLISFALGILSNTLLGLVFISDDSSQLLPLTIASLVVLPLCDVASSLLQLRHSIKGGSGFTKDCRLFMKVVLLKQGSIILAAILFSNSKIGQAILETSLAIVWALGIPTVFFSLLLIDLLAQSKHQDSIQSKVE